MSDIHTALDAAEQYATAGVWAGHPLAIILEALIKQTRAALAKPVGEGPSAADLLPVNPPNISTTMAMQYRSAWREGVEDGWNEARAVLARWGTPAAPPAPEAGEVGELVEILTQEAAILEAHCNKMANGECRTLACLQRGGYVRGTEPPDSSVATCPELEKAVAKRRAATLLQQLSAPAPVVVPRGECPHCGYEGEMARVPQAGEVPNV